MKLTNYVTQFRKFTRARKGLYLEKEKQKWENTRGNTKQMEEARKKNFRR